MGSWGEIKSWINAQFTELYRKTREPERMTAELEQRVAERTSELVDAVQRQCELAQQLPQANQRKDGFLALLGHALRDPLAPVRNAVAILRVQNTAQNEALNWCVDVIER